MSKPRKIIVLDDDPTGSQTVHSCPLLLRWDRTTLETGLRHPSPLLFLLTNSRSLTPEEAGRVTREVCRELRAARVEERFAPIYVSRSDSTLRGHFPLETDVMAESLGPFDAIFLTPAFFEGGRITRKGVHYIARGESLTRVDQTQYATDSVFGFKSSNLPEYVEEKSSGRIRAADVSLIPRGLSEAELQQRLTALEGRACVVVDGEEQSDFDRFAGAVRNAVGTGKRFLFRSGASLLTSLASLPPQPVAPEEMGGYVRPGSAPGVIVCGSHVELTNRQLAVLLKEPGVAPVEVDVERAFGDEGSYEASLRERVADALSDGFSPAVFTSREERHFDSKEERLYFGRGVSRFIVRIVRALPKEVGFLISKGGITSNDLLSAGLDLGYAAVLGQILPGITVVRTPDHHRMPGVPVAIFPGNVGESESLRTVYRRLSGL